ncbi:MAG TPA: DinB family protein [Vicinamibacterales bacterium]|jgi:uncharacterized damage-inducible protein DinB|nr:DinB family protein [Vicinamibacterales bacterium]
MNHYGGKDMATSFRTVRGNTLKIAEEIPEDKYGFSAAPGTRTIGQLLTHIAFIPSVQTHIQGTGVTDLKAVNFPALMGQMMAQEATPRSKAEIIALLTSEADKFAAFLEGRSDAFLAERVAVPPGGGDQQSRSRFEMLLSCKEHEMHHRGQLMTMERMIGVTPHLTRQMMERMAQMQAQPAAR